MAAHRRTPHRLVLALFFASGVSGLIYQVVWVRNLALVLGNTLSSAALVTGVFMGGLGIGSLLAGRIADRRHAEDRVAPLRLYGWAEVAIAVLGMILAFAIPRLTGLSASVSAYQLDAAGWHVLSWPTHVARHLGAILLIAPPTLLMGGTLTLLSRFLVGHRVAQAGWRIALLYGVNTGGAALGALATDFLLVPEIGIVATQLVAVAANLIAAIGALLLASRLRASADQGADEEPGEAAPAEATLSQTGGQTRVLQLAATALFATGFAAMGIEILWFRFIGQITGALRSVFSLLLTVILLGMWLGSLVAGRLSKHRPAHWFALVQALLVVAFIALIAGIDHYGDFHRALSAVRDDYVAGTVGERRWISLAVNARPIVAIAAIPALAMGFAFPLANAVVQRSAAAVGRSAGWLYLGNTAGNVLGATLVGFVLLPGLGIRWSTLLLAVVAIAGALPLLVIAQRERASRGARWVTLGALTAAIAAVVVFVQLPAERLLSPAIPRDDQGGTRRLVAVSEGAHETLAVIEVPAVRRELFTNGHPMSSSSATAQRYMRGFAHVPLLHREAPTDVLVICFGVGNTTHAASLHPSLERLDVADLSRNVLEHASLFSATNGDVLEDERVAVFVNDGRHHLLLQPPERYDLVTLEPPPIAFAGVSSLYSEEMYRLAHSRLKPGGLMTQWLPAYQVPEGLVLAIVRSFIEVFPGAVLLSGDQAELILMGQKAGPDGGTPRLAPAELERRLAARPAVMRDLAAIHLATPKQFFGTFVAAGDVLARATIDAERITDDAPLLEYGHHSSLQARELPASLFDTTTLPAWCADCDQVAGLADYLALQQRIYTSDVFLRSAPGALPLDDARARAIIDDSPYLQLVLGGEVVHVERLARGYLGRGEAEAAVAAYRRVVYLAPDSPDAHFGLGLALARGGLSDAAEAELARTVALSPDHPAANAVLCRRALAAGRRDEARARCRTALAGGVDLSPELRAIAEP